MLYATEQTCTEGMIVSLDAEKAFDSIEHWYIKEILKKIGLNKFVKVFEILYKNQGVEIYYFRYFQIKNIIIKWKSPN